MPDTERMTLSPHMTPGYAPIFPPRRKFSTGSLIAIILTVKVSGLILTIVLAVAAVLSQTHPEIINLRPLVEGNIRANPPASVAVPMAMLPTIVSLTENAMANGATAQAMQPGGPSATLAVIQPSDVSSSATPTLLNTATTTATASLSPTAAETLTPSTTPTIQPSATQTATITLTSSPTATLYPYSLTAYSENMSTPLQGVGFGELHTIISQPYDVPDVHSDVGHHGVDLGSYDFHGKLIYNWPILSIFSGKVAGVVVNRYPIGNCIIVETAYSQLPSEIVDESGIKPEQSLYSMYCHMLNAATQKIGDPVTAAQAIGLVGKSQTVEAHLHLEMVMGPPNQVIPSMAYYNGDATENEKKAYMWWRTSGTFISFNPMNLIANLK
jgi:murein DD-endopeptidase MepM/ murein hydrolase activator NlpD